MKRGKKLFNEVGVTPNLFGLTPLAKGKKKGRSVELLQQRDERLVARLFYYRTFHSYLRNEIIMKFLMLEFDLSDIRIVEVLDGLTIEIQKLKNENPDLKTLKEKWFFMDWTDKMITAAK